MCHQGPSFWQANKTCDNFLWRIYPGFKLASKLKLLFISNAWSLEGSVEVKESVYKDGPILENQLYPQSEETIKALHNFHIWYATIIRSD